MNNKLIFLIYFFLLTFSKLSVSENKMVGSYTLSECAVKLNLLWKENVSEER